MVRTGPATERAQARLERDSLIGVNAGALVGVVVGALHGWVLGAALLGFALACVAGVTVSVPAAVGLLRAWRRDRERG